MVIATVLPAMQQLDLFPASAVAGESELYTRDGTRLTRTVRRRNGVAATSAVDDVVPDRSPDDAYDLSWLRAAAPPPMSRPSAELTLVDLFSGCGALSLGVVEAGRALGIKIDPVAAMDVMPEALATYGRNFHRAQLLSDPIESLVDGDLGSPPTLRERQLFDRLGDVDFVVGGPPCQGHSDLNNHTRRDDPRNALYVRVARFVELAKPNAVVIENVPGVIHDRAGVAQTTWRYLAALGYHLDGIVMRAAQVGVPQLRKRYVMAASAVINPNLSAAVQRHAVATRSISWSIDDLLDTAASGVFDTPASHAPQNRRRIEYLFEHDLFELPDEQRPDCHRLKPHSYRSVYGRLRWDQPSGTITGGFGSTGQGRFVHPFRQRTITPHEAARIQFIPDYFTFPEVGRGALQEMIGNAVPPRLGYVAAMELLR